MELESEPLIRTFKFQPRPSFWRRIPSEITITGVILGCFLLVVTLLIVIENKGSSTKDELHLDSNLLGSPLNYDKRISDKSIDSKDPSKSKDFMDEWKKSYEVENIMNSLKLRMEAETLLLEMFDKYKKMSKKSLLTEEDFEKVIQDATKGDLPLYLLDSTPKYNKKSLDPTWQDKKDKYVKSDDPNQWKFDSVDKGFKTLGASVDLGYNDKKMPNEDEVSELGTPFMINREYLEKIREKANQLLESANSDIIKEEFKKSLSDMTAQEDLKKFYDEWNEAENLLKAEQPESEKESSYKAVPKGCPFADMDVRTLQTAPVPKYQINCAMIAEELRRKLGKCIDLSFLPRECKPNWRNKCFSTYKYRKIDGTCNNQIHPTWGKNSIPFVRMMAPAYSDGVSKIRSAMNGGELPNPRFLSQQLYSKRLKPDSNATFLFLSFGLIIDHDMVETAFNTDGIQCCDSKYKTLVKDKKPGECLEIDVPEKDPFYGPKNVKCLNLVRSIPTNGDCIGRREQLNKATSFLDGSAIYGSTIDRMKALRSFNKGQLRTAHINNTPFMAFSNASHTCGTPYDPLKCFEAGDPRVNMLVALTVMHTIWYREHNRLAEELSKLNSKWTDEILFQEARRILIAELQHIAYNEFLPLLLGDEAMEYFQLAIEPNQYYDGYDDTIDPSVFNVFGSAAFRFGHSLVQDMIHLVGPNNKSEGKIPLHQTYFNPELLYHNGLDLLLRGAATQKLHSVDSFISEEIRDRLFQPFDKDFGHDLAAVGIQRGRDHGLKPYIKWRSACGLSEVRSWEDLNDIMHLERAKKLREVYQSVDDIDLIPGALAEHHPEGSLLGPTYLCIIGKQFQKTRKGDRFWYEMQDTIGSFTKEQLQEIYKSTMARIVCDNADKIQSMQKLPFRLPSNSNSIVNCDDHPRLDLSKWKTGSFY